MSTSHHTSALNHHIEEWKTKSKPGRDPAELVHAIEYKCRGPNLSFTSFDHTKPRQNGCAENKVCPSKGGRRSVGDDLRMGLPGRKLGCRRQCFFALKFERLHRSGGLCFRWSKDHYLLVGGDGLYVLEVVTTKDTFMEVLGWFKCLQADQFACQDRGVSHNARIVHNLGV